MPGKPRHGKGKQSHSSKKSKAKQRHGTMALPQPLTTDAPQPATTTTPPVSRAPSPPRAKTAQYPYITAELRGIGILAGIILAILVVLALVLP